MKQFLFSLFAIAVWCSPLYAQRRCGIDEVNASLIARDATWRERLEQQRASLQAKADNYSMQPQAAAGQKTTATSPVPVIFHFLVTSSQHAQLGGDAGIAQRVDSQIAVLNRDYNRGNLDSVLIPALWKPLYGNAGIQFALAHTNPWGYASPGYDIRIIPSLPGGYSGVSEGYRKVKYDSTGGADAWDVTKYLNIWCVNFTDISGLLGLTISKSKAGTAGYPINEIGLCINYAAVGKRVSTSDFYIATGFGSNYYDQGRTITHEMGHFFEIWHTWGDDGGLCPWTGGTDDGFADTPPEANQKYYAYPYTIPGGTYIDSCHHNGATDMQPIGAATLDFMNYTDDVAMQLFTPDQAAAMASEVSATGQHYQLTQHPSLLLWGPVNAVAEIEKEKHLNIYPNPSTGQIMITFNRNSDELKQVSITDILGRETHRFTTAGSGADHFSADLSALDKGIYFVRCTFASGSITRKILLQ